MSDTFLFLFLKIWAATVHVHLGNNGACCSPSHFKNIYIDLADNVLFMLQVKLCDHDLRGWNLLHASTQEGVVKMCSRLS